MKLFRIFDKESDRNHRFTICQLLEKLEIDNPTSNDARNVRNDITILRDAGYEIATVRHKAPEHYLSQRRFTPAEIKILVDIVQSSRSITKEISDNLVESLLSLGSESQAQDIRTSIRVGNRVKMHNDQLFHNISTIQKALRDRHKIQFRYFNYNFDFEREYHTDNTGSCMLTETPLLITYVDGGYYAITYSEEKKRTVTRRIDRMDEVSDCRAKATWKVELQNFDIDERTLFGMFLGKEESVTFTAKKEAMNALVDRFGHDMTIRKSNDGDTARITVKVVKSPQFDGWVHGLGDLITLDE